MSRLFIERFGEPDTLNETLRAAMDWLHVGAIVAPNARVFIKPNLTWKQPTPGVTVTPAFLKALVQTLRELTPHITIGESEGGQACFQAEEAFESHGLYGLEREYDVRVVNLSKGPQEAVSALVDGKRVTVELPTLLLHEVDVFISVPVPKVHAMTGVSIGFKNQWGCLGDKMRVRLHPHFNQAIVAINKILAPRLCICDGTYMLDKTGPMVGEPVPMGLLIAADDIGAASIACCEVMQIDPMTIAHYRLARNEGMFPWSLADLEANRPPGDFANHPFRVRRAPVNYVQMAAFRNVLLNRMFYDSVSADALHEILWLIRRQPFVKRFLYGRFGTGEANRGGRIV